MAGVEAAAVSEPGQGVRAITVQPITVRDAQDALTEGWRDLLAGGPFSLIFGAVYAVAGIVIVAMLLRDGSQHLVFPTMAMFLLVGPITAVGLYEISRRLEAGEALSFGPVFGAFLRHGGVQLALFGFLLAFVAIAWFKLATIIYAVFFGVAPQPLDEMIRVVATTREGLAFLVVGNLVGAALAVFVFCVSVVSVPMLLDRDVDLITAVSTSVAAVRESPRAFISFGVMVVTLIGVGMALFMVGLALTLPLIGHATWRLYRKAIA